MEHQIDTDGIEIGPELFAVSERLFFGVVQVLASSIALI
jgi:hypothetical protein